MRRPSLQEVLLRHGRLGRADQRGRCGVVGRARRGHERAAELMRAGVRRLLLVNDK